ncbi:hypothetical protein MMC17_002165 [Xylographa soralifera]|nr:hypothetical protein [Xylographa soralifera]
MPSIPFPLPTPSTLTPSILSSLLALYAPTLAHLASTKRAPKPPSSTPDLLALDLLRYTTIPARVRARRTATPENSNGEPPKPSDGSETEPPPTPYGWLEKPELELLMAWKLTRGHPRPTLPALIRSNTPALVRSTTQRAYALFAADTADPFPALKQLAQLRGVGPATASLLLAVGWPEEVPFFADELLGWLRGGEGGKVRYDWREYGEVWEGVRKVRGLVGGGAEEVERGAWAVGMLGRGEVERGVRGLVDGGGGEGADGRGVGGEGDEAPVGEVVVAGEAGAVEKGEKGRGKRKVVGETEDGERTAKVPRRRKVETLKEEKAADGAVRRRSSSNKQ